MLLLVSAFFLTLLQCSNAQNKASITPADCNTIETDAGVALDLVNKHRRDGYVFGLFRVADAHELHTGNSSVLYLTLDVLETECPVLSRKHWESCEYSDTYPMDFGQCKIITYTNHLLKKPQLYGFNCTLSPVPPDLLECKDCPVKIEVLEVTEQHKDIATKALKKFNSEGNHTNYFAVVKVERVLKMTASREGHILGFSIKETNCSKSMQQEDQALECDFLHDWHTHMGFCKARIISDADEADGTDISCEIYHPWHGYGRRGKCGKPHRHPHFHHHFGHRHHHRHHHRHECPPSSQPRPEDPEHNHNFSKEDQDSHEVPALSIPPPSHDEPDHHHPPHHHGPHCPPPHHHGPHCPPPPHGPDHHHPPHHHGPHCPPPFPPPPPPPPHGPDHHHTPHRHGPHCPPPPPPHGPDHHHPPHHHGPHHPPPPGHHPHHCHHHYRHHCNKTSMSGKYFPCHITGTVYHIPVLNRQDTLTPPSANFYELSQFIPHSSSTGEGISFTGSSPKEIPEDPGFPDHPTQSKSCPGKPKLVLPKILPLFPQSSMAENSPI
ncbi:histidine-rich glycoprotein isoform X2 [Pithys albifrons albifrons]|uniref:histidine-rich glycoprotein isoform X2 n=1 Tax=Pithys albifrons albifrons TaxID=3385563 RepID=UPI003A5D106B